MGNDPFGSALIKEALANAKPPHPLIDGSWDLSSRAPKSTNFILNGWVPTGICTFAGDSGTGKTSAIFPMALAAAGLIKDGRGVRPPAFERRKVIYHAEDVQQLKRMVELLKSDGLVEGDIDDWLMVVEAKRLPVERYCEDFDGTELQPFYSRCYRGDELLELPPLIVFDTYQECFAINDENNNSEVVQGIAKLKHTLKDHADGVWIVAHTAKGTSNRRVRGASAIEGVVNQTFSVSWKGNLLWMEVGKSRSDLFQKKMVLRAHQGTVGLIDRWGHQKLERVTVSFLDVPSEEERAAAEEEKLQRLWKRAQEALEKGPKTKTELTKLLGGRKDSAIKAIDGWLGAGRLVGVKGGKATLVLLPA